jgi:sporulation protein YlmC with PRC-barrel domain
MKTEYLHAGLDLLDRQIIDKDGELVGKVDDVELSDPEPGEPPRITSLLLGPQAYGQRLGGRLGRWIAASGARLAGTNEPIRIPIEHVADLGVSIRLHTRGAEIERVERLDGWLREHFIERIPGARRASE